MRALIALSLLYSILSAESFADPAPAASPPACQLPQIASLEMTIRPRGGIAVPASVNGHPIRMIVDTGDIYSGISWDTVAMLGLHAKAAPFQSRFLGGVPSNDYVVLDKFELQPFSIPNFEMMAVPNQMFSPGVQGILGPSLMKALDVEFDFAHAKFNLFSQDHCPHNVVYWTRDGYSEIPITVDREFHIRIPVKLNGESIHAVIDSGADRSTMRMGTAKELFDLNENSPGMKNVGKISINGLEPVDIHHYPFATMSFGGVQVNNPLIDIMPDEAYDRRFPELIIGINILRQLHLYIAYKEERLYVTPAETH